jgi:hypothetical protein
VTTPARSTPRSTRPWLRSRARAVILDISNNDGGFDSVAQHIAGRFAERPALAYRKIAFGAKDGAAGLRGHTVTARTPLGPVFLLTSDITLSAGEVLALYMRALPNVRHVGETTRGAFSDTTNKPLPNGWTLICRRRSTAIRRTELRGARAAAAAPLRGVPARRSHRRPRAGGARADRRHPPRGAEQRALRKQPLNHP